jgi:opacity protein-like surface antigen
MQLKSLICAAACAALAAGFGLPEAQAQMATAGNLYVGLNAGVLIPEAISTHQTGTVGSETVTLSGDYNFDTGAAAGLIVGYRLNAWLAVEGNFQYGGVDFSSFTGTGTVTGPVSGSGPINLGVKGHIDTYSGLFNGVLLPAGRAGWMGFSPYIGGGAGFTTWDGTIDSISANGATATLNQSHSETDFAADAIAGVDFALTPQIALGLRYQFLWASLSNLSSGNGITGSNSDFFGHMITATGTWHF